ncbi:hypothetical protein LMH87_004508 [Akanthomyces muscarius]|uniref:Uncharacterized protein n=1 Tax=Akanthomyces muscarius TaxID=2231603 RepID=A0A9W8Q478_AKAMU|nr:hypothetical protein LMH87_004508 [Akanthomyces muscarius]KAJ4145668.1 hypothetical protein LMH87_004508 [Akanthomyces muscarius]
MNLGFISSIIRNGLHSFKFVRTCMGILSDTSWAKLNHHQTPTNTPNTIYHEAAADNNNAWFMDLFVRKSNERAITFYKSMGYSVFRVVKDYYGDHATDATKYSEDAFDMRKSMKRDVKHEHVRDAGEDHEVDPEDVW